LHYGWGSNGLRKKLLWFLLAGLMQAVVKIFGSQSPYVDTVSVCLRVMPLAYVMSALLVFALSVFTEPYSMPSKNVTFLGTAFIAIQLAILAIYFPAGMRKVHHTSVWSQVVMAVVVISVVGTVNGFYMLTAPSDQHAQGGKSPVMRPALMD
jgi:drug/metabolite transporter (DMT)-like permease